MSEVANLLLSILMLAVGGLGWGAAVLWRRGERSKGALMAVAGLVLLGNVLILTL